MAKQQVYLETTVLSAYYDSRSPERLEMTVRFFQERVDDFDAFVSSLVLDELRQTPDEKRRTDLSKLAEDYRLLELDDEVNHLARQYVEQNVIPEKYVSDAIHVAVAVVNRIDYLCSWNFSHLVRVRTRREVNLVSSLNGYGSIEIVAPPEL